MNLELPGRQDSIVQSEQSGARSPEKSNFIIDQIIRIGLTDIRHLSLTTFMEKPESLLSFYLNQLGEKIRDVENTDPFRIFDFADCLTENQVDYVFKLDLTRTYVIDLIHFAMKIQCDQNSDLSARLNVNSWQPGAN